MRGSSGIKGQILEDQWIQRKKYWSVLCVFILISWFWCCLAQAQVLWLWWQNIIVVNIFIFCVNAAFAINICFVFFFRAIYLAFDRNRTRRRIVLFNLTYTMLVSISSDSAKKGNCYEKPLGSVLGKNIKRGMSYYWYYVKASKRRQVRSSMLRTRMLFIWLMRYSMI
jgi:hypothetical protein